MGSSAAFPTLFSPAALGGDGAALELRHRVVLAPLTRCRASDATQTPDPRLFAAYYAQRATPGGLLISEATNVSWRAKGDYGSPGIFEPAHVAAWRTVTAAVAARAPGCVFFCQLWHTGRQAHSRLTRGARPVAPSAIARPGSLTLPSGETVPFEVPHELRDDEIPGIVAEYLHAARCALDAGFDGVEIHAANSYLLDQFLQDGSNRRPPPYGGPAANRSRLLADILDAMLASDIPSARIAVRLSPYGTWAGVSTSDPETIWPLAVYECGRRNLAYVHCTEPPNRRHTAHLDLSGPSLAPCVAALRRANSETESQGKQGFRPTLFMACGRYLAASADLALRPEDEGGAGYDLVAFGRLFISNPDLVDRFRRNLELTRYDTKTFYTQGAEGYLDYPAYGDPDGPFGRWGRFRGYLASHEWEPEVAAEAGDEEEG
ncbi:NADH-flavin oxidoreductase/NADH oxidase [Hyaloraphidium curvatum]|nr:NADH-flavin oxidoreductase/NADH oxidase [Hyaloraphidium curvatum]